jgi:hypothetical protein
MNPMPTSFADAFARHAREPSDKRPIGRNPPANQRIAGRDASEATADRSARAQNTSDSLGRKQHQRS